MLVITRGGIHHCFFREALFILQHGAVYLLRRSSFGFHQACMLARREVFSATWRIYRTIRLVVPVADINHIYERCILRVLQDSVLHIFGGTETDQWLLLQC